MGVVGKRNKRTVRVAVPTLNGLTEKILQQMGPEGARLRERLLQFLLERAVTKEEQKDLPAPRLLE